VQKQYELDPGCWRKTAFVASSLAENHFVESVPCTFRDELPIVKFLRAAKHASTSTAVAVLRFQILHVGNAAVQ
jgi:hypothetical protein